ncbi:tetratricopeptide repeat protein, partial [Bacteroidales bacterium OttesenSCG-928-I14]|nr:tetratricopeptide repeat protein [Bacteroidales bacterium OttesenSCG-928-I14]
KSYRYHNMAIIYQEMGENSMAEYYLRKAIEISKNEPYNMARYLQNLAYLLFQSNKLSDAENYYRQALAIAEEADIKQVKSSVLIELSDLYNKKNLHRQAWGYLREGVELRDSIFGIENMEKISLISQQFENYKITSEKELLEKELQLAKVSSQKKNITVSVLVVLLILISGLTFFLIHRIKKKSVMNIEKETKSAERSIRKEYENTLEGKNRELASNALYMMKTNEILTSLEQSIRQLIAIKDSTKRDEIIREMGTVIKSYNASQSWDEFKLYFEQVHPSFYLNLNKINPNLSKIEQRLSALLVLNMSTKEIAAVTNRSIRTIETLIYRLRKNLNIPAEEKTTSYLRKLLDSAE